MRWALRVALLGLLLVPASLAHSGHGGPETYIVTAHEAETANGTLGWFTVDNRTTPNPSLEVSAGQRLFLHVVNAGSANHTFALGEPVDRKVGPIAPGNETSLQLEIPRQASDSIVYQDPGWADRGMIGRLDVAGAESQRSTPGITGWLLLSLATASALGIHRQPDT